MAQLGKKPEYGLIFLLANALTAALTYIFTLRGIAKQLNEAQRQLTIVQAGSKKPSVRKMVSEPVGDGEVDAVKVHRGQYL